MENQQIEAYEDIVAAANELIFRGNVIIVDMILLIGDEEIRRDAAIFHVDPIQLEQDARDLAFFEAELQELRDNWAQFQRDSERLRVIMDEFEGN